MFDGNHRSKRRSVNLGGRSRPATKQTVVQKSLQERQERQKRILQHKAARCIQKNTRGFLHRQHVLWNILPKAIQESLLQTQEHPYLSWRNLQLRLLVSSSTANSTTSSISSRTTILREMSRDIATHPPAPSRVHRFIFQAALESYQTTGTYSSQAAGTTTTQAHCTIALFDLYSHLPIVNPQTTLQLCQTMWALQQHPVAFQYLFDKVPNWILPENGKEAIWILFSLLKRENDASSKMDESLRQFVFTLLEEGHASTNNHHPIQKWIHETVQSSWKIQQRILQSSTCFLDFLSYLWNCCPTHSLILNMTGKILRGENYYSSSTNSKQIKMDENEEEEDDSDVDSDPSHNVQAHKKTRTMNQFLTIPKLDRIYRQQQQARFVSVDETKLYQDGFEKVVYEIIQPQPWIQAVVGPVNILQPTIAATTTTTSPEQYIHLLFSMLDALQTTYSVRSTADSQFLRHLALNDEFLTAFWQYILVRQGQSNITYYQAMSIFCDIFAQKLIALRDEHFLQRYIPNVGEQVRLDVCQVVQILRDALYEQYWSRPIKSQDFDTLVEPTQKARARLLLTGTKLWNVLYERWCRLFPRPFCDESLWWFPNVTILSTESAVGGNSEHMDVDDDSSLDDQNMEDAELDALASTFRDPKMARVLTSIPQALPFDRRVRLFDTLLKQDKANSQDERSEMHQAMVAMMRGDESLSRGREQVEIHRDQMYTDSMRQLNSLGSKLKRKVRISFVNRHGAQEAGIDGGGVFKEFIDDLIAQAFSPDGDDSSIPRLFSVTPLENLAVNVDLAHDRSLLPHYEFLGRVMGKAVYESILVEPQFCLPFLNQLLGKQNSLEDLKNYDPEFYSNLTKLLSLDSTTLNDLGLTFETTIGSGASIRSFELVPGGRSRAVNKSNVVEYVYMVTHYRLNVQSSIQVKAFLRGFRDLIPGPWVRIFSAHELQKLVSGDDSVRGIDVASLKASMEYASGYHPSQPVVQYFWEILEEMSADEQRKFLKFMTSCSRQPLLGFASLSPPPCVQQIRLPDEMFVHGNPARDAPLPSSSTCMNLLKLPNYRSKELMRSKLLAAIEAGAGFELS